MNSENIFQKVERYLVNNKPEYSYLWDCWSRMYYYAYPEYYFFNDLTKHYSFYIKCHDGTFVVNFVNTHDLNNNGYNNIYADLCKDPIKYTIRYLLIYQYIKHYYSSQSRTGDRYCIDSIVDESFSNNGLTIKNKNGYLTTIKISNVVGVSNASIHH